MKQRIALLGAALVALGSVSACGGGGSGQAMTTATPPPTVTSLSIDTVQLLAQAQQVSETSSPYPVNGGALVLTGTSDSAEPISVNGS